MKILLSTGSLNYMPLEDVFQTARELSFAGLELYLRHPDDLKRIHPQMVRDLSVKTGINVCSVHFPSFERYLKDYLLGPSAFVQRVFTESLAFSKELGAQIMVVHPFPALFFRRRAERRMKTLLEQAREGMSVLPARYAAGGSAQAGVPGNPLICVENLPRVGPFLPHALVTDGQFSSFCEETGYGMIVDLTHCRSANLLPHVFFEKVSRIVRNIHFSDFKNGIQHLPPGEGDTDFDAFFKVLKKVLYHGYLTLELMPKWYKKDGKEVVRDAKRFVEEKWDG